MSACERCGRPTKWDEVPRRVTDLCLEIGDLACERAARQRAERELDKARERLAIFHTYAVDSLANRRISFYSREGTCDCAIGCPECDVVRLIPAQEIRDRIKEIELAFAGGGDGLKW